MNPGSLGDSHDVVKRFLCDVSRSLRYDVHVDPMFTGSWTASESKAFLRFIGARPVDSTVPNMSAVLLIDPDRGIGSRPGLAQTTLSAIATRCQQFGLVLVSDPPRRRRQELIRSLFALGTMGVRGVYFDAHARFLICGRSSARVMRFQKALTEAGLPRSRFVGIRASAPAPSWLRV